MPTPLELIYIGMSVIALGILGGAVGWFYLEGWSGLAIGVLIGIPLGGILAFIDSRFRPWRRF